MLEGYKTYIAGFGAFFVAIGKLLTDFATIGIQTGDIELVVTALIALSVIFLRKGLKQTSEEIDTVKDVIVNEKKEAR